MSLLSFVVWCVGQLLTITIWPATSIYLVVATWFSATSPRLASDVGVRSGVRRLVLGGDTRALQVTILAFVGRAVWGWFAELLRVLGLNLLLTPFVGVLLHVLLIAFLAPMKNQILFHFRQLWPAELADGLDRFLVPPAYHTGLVTGGVAVLAILWGRTPALLGWALLPLLRLSIRSYTFVASLHAVAKGDEHTLLEWQWYWLLSSLLVPTLRNTLPLPALIKRCVLLVLSVFLLVDRGSSIPYLRRARLALKLYLRGLPDTVLDGDPRSLDGNRHLRELGDAWRVARVTRAEGGSAAQTRARFQGIVNAAHAAAQAASPPVSRMPSAPEPHDPPAAADPVTNPAEAETECVICCCDISCGEPRALCPGQHPTCSSCFNRLFEDCLSRTMHDLTAGELAASRYMVKCCSGGCDYHFGLKEMTKNMTEEQAVRWEEINKRLYKDINLEEWVRLRTTRDAEDERIESIRASFRDGRGQYVDVYQCPRCTFGPKPQLACRDLAAHHGQRVVNPRTGVAYVIDNSCERCKFFTSALGAWDVWDGTVWPQDAAKADELGAVRLREKQERDQSRPPSDIEQILLDIGCELQAIRRLEGPELQLYGAACQVDRDDYGDGDDDDAQQQYLEEVRSYVQEELLEMDDDAFKERLAARLAGGAGGAGGARPDSGRAPDEDAEAPDDEDGDDEDGEDRLSAPPTSIEKFLLEMGWALERIRAPDVQRAIHPDEVGTLEDFDDDEREYRNACMNAALEVLNQGEEGEGSDGSDYF